MRHEKRLFHLPLFAFLAVAAIAGPAFAEPGADLNGIPVAARYVFDIAPDIAPADLPGPLLGITFDANGNPCVKLPP